MRHVFPIAIVVAVLGGVLPASADDEFARSTWQPCADVPMRGSPWAVNWAATSVAPAPRLSMPSIGTTNVGAAEAADQATTGRRRAIAVEYSDAYKIRNKIHKIASYTTIPLFVAEYWVGAYMYAYPVNITSSLQSVHRTLGMSIGSLFAVNTVTGVWNLWDGRKDPNHRGRRMLHGITMLAADAGFAVSGAMRPSLRGGVDNYYHQRMVHRAIATTSMVVSGISYLMMLFGGGE
ncbi:MAG: hypothetical protein NT151_01775 [Acidobacteria bacterium]|nr:hypothetical protein [Acidobacteriota bacterium]